MMTGTEVVFGREEAGQRAWTFESAYRFVSSDERGKFVDGHSPDGRTEGMCSRCGACIANVYVFSDGAGTFMHVGIDCAQRMGVPFEQLQRARHFYRDAAREASERAKRASLAERRAAEEAERAARLAENAALVEELRALAQHPHATAWERERLESLVNHVADNGGAFAQWSPFIAKTYGGDRAASVVIALRAIRARLDLCTTSREMTGDKKGAITVTLTAYRDPIHFETAYGTSHVSFLRDNAGNAYVYKGAKVAWIGDEITLTASVDGADVRDGLTATRLKRPRKATVRRAEDTDILGLEREW